MSKYILIVLILLFGVGCASSVPEFRDVSPLGNIHNASSKVDTSISLLSAEPPQIEPAKASLLSAKNELGKASKKTREVEKDYNGQGEKIGELEEEAKAGGRRHLLWLMGISIAGVGIGVALAAMGISKQIGITLAIASAASAFVAYAIAQWAWLIGLGIVVVGVGYALYRLRILHKAFGELVELVDRLKGKLPAEVKVEVFGGEDGEARKTQSPQTQTLVKQIRKA